MTGIAAALAKSAASVESRGPADWSFLLSNGTRLSARLRLEDDWLALDVPLNGRHSKRSPWVLVRLNAELPGSCKLVHRPGSSLPTLATDLPLEGDADLTTRLGDACHGLAGAFARLDNKPDEDRGHPAATPEEDQDDLERLCSDAGWPLQKGNDGTLVVETGADLLEEGPDERRRFLGQGIIGGVPRRLQLQALSQGVRVWLTLARLGSLSAESRKAVGILLLRVSGAVRLARASVKKADAGSELQVEVGLPRTPSAGEIDHALSSVCVAATRCGPEVAALQHRFLATKYVELSTKTVS